MPETFCSVMVTCSILPAYCGDQAAWTEPPSRRWDLTHSRSVWFLHRRLVLPESERSPVGLAPDFGAVGVRPIQRHVDRVWKVAEAEAVLMRHDAEEMNSFLRRNEDVAVRRFVSGRFCTHTSARLRAASRLIDASFYLLGRAPMSASKRANTSSTNA